MSSSSRYYREGLTSLERSGFEDWAYNNPITTVNGQSIYKGGINWYNQARLIVNAYGLAIPINASPSIGDVITVCIPITFNCDTATGIISGTYWPVDVQSTNSYTLYYISPPGRPQLYDGQPKRALCAALYYTSGPSDAYQPFSVPDPYWPKREPGTLLNFNLIYLYNNICIPNPFQAFAS